MVHQSLQLRCHAGILYRNESTEDAVPQCFAVSILAATRLTGSMYPTTNFAGQLGTAQCENTKEALQACWVSVAFAWVFVAAYSLIGPVIL